MATVKHIETKRIQLTDNRPRDDMNNEISFTSSESSTSDPITKFKNFYRTSYIQSQSDSEGPLRRSRLPRSSRWCLPRVKWTNGPGVGQRGLNCSAVGLYQN
ncbi:uncharacterized protein LOC120635821 [Pararge aegeria]|uniref:uncharacterized protein LOC120635821 n=1 Tax=Pararge aegeria TaxID=116150 RepID=UPI0019CFFD9F|nr:uncharacterized protein LOC120635821 [Pararge aegeria]